jgi:hypothetical protein
MDFIFPILSSLEEPLQKIVPAARISTRDEYESFIGTRIPDVVEIHLPNVVKSKGRCKRIKKSKEIKLQAREELHVCVANVSKLGNMMHTIAQRNETYA